MSCSMLCFNSMIVRLKDSPRKESEGLFSQFQFYDSPIKSFPEAKNRVQRQGFNSMIVRLKAQAVFAAPAASLDSFNSMIVRLKAFQTLREG